MRCCYDVSLVSEFLHVNVSANSATVTYEVRHIMLKHSKITVNFNLYNIDGKIPLHIFLENYTPQEQKYLDLLLRTTIIPN